MKLKIRCQICGYSGIIDTQKPIIMEDFNGYQLSEFIEVEHHCEYDIWLCSQCDEKYRGWRANSSENYYKPLIDSLKINITEIRINEWNELKAEGIIEDK